MMEPLKIHCNHYHSSLRKKKIIGKFSKVILIRIISVGILAIQIVSTQKLFSSLEQNRQLLMIIAYLYSPWVITCHGKRGHTRMEVFYSDKALISILIKIVVILCLM